MRPQPCAAELLILQHPQEAGHAKNSARLLHLSLPAHSRLAVAEVFAPQDLQALLHAPWQAGQPAPRTLLLYPPSPDPSLPTPPPLPAHWQAQMPQHLRLVLLDATWRKSRKMLYLNPTLHSLPRLPLAAVPATRYRIRQAQQAGQLASFEAAVLALAQCQALRPSSVQALWQSFENWLQKEESWAFSSSSIDSSKRNNGKA